MERVIVVHSTHARAAAADREALRQLAPQARLERLLRMQQAYREQFGEAGRGMVRIVRVFDRSPR